MTTANERPGFVENGWVGHELRFGDRTRINVALLDPRCVMTTLAQDNLPQDTDVLRPLANHNKDPSRRSRSVPLCWRVRRDRCAGNSTNWRSGDDCLTTHHDRAAQPMGAAACIRVSLSFANAFGVSHQSASSKSSYEVVAASGSTTMTSLTASWSTTELGAVSKPTAGIGNLIAHAIRTVRIFYVTYYGKAFCVNIRGLLGTRRDSITPVIANEI